MTLDSVLDVVAGVCLLLGAFLALVAAIGLVRFPDLLTRMHSATKPQVLGQLLILLGLALRLRDVDSLGVLLLVALAQMATAPVAAHMVGRAAFRTGQVRQDLLVVDELSRAMPASADGRRVDAETVDDLDEQGDVLR